MTADEDAHASRNLRLAQRTGTRLYHKKKTLKDAITRCKEVNEKWRARVLDYARPLLRKQTSEDGKLLKALLGLKAYSGPIRASDLPAVRRFGLTCIRVVHAYWRAVQAYRWFHITLFADEFHISERRPVLLLKKLKGKAYKEIQELGLNALVWIDVDAVPNHPQGGLGGTFLFHVHALCFTERDFDIDAARQKLKRSRSWSCKFHAEPTDITEITRSKGTAAWWANYGAKPPYRAKRCVISRDGTVTLRWTEDGYRGQTAMRLAEGLAQLALFDTFFAVGEGKDLREEIRLRVMHWHRKRWPHQRRLELNRVAALLRRFWLLTRVRRYRRWQIIGATV